MRRALFACFGLVLLALPAGADTPALPSADPEGSPPTCRLPVTTPQEREALWQELVEGNRAFAGGDVHYAGLGILRRGMASWQSPPIAALSCADSRVMPEILFARTVGELFVSRVAGNITVANDFNIASLDYGVYNGWTPLIVVMGHSDCGAVITALKNCPGQPPTSALGALVGRIRAGFARYGIQLIPCNNDPTAAQLRAAVVANARYSASQLQQDSLLLKSCVEAGRLLIVPAYYDVGTGEVERLTP